MKNRFVSVAFYLGTAISLFWANSVLSQDNDTTSIETASPALENITIFGTRKAYQGDFVPLETPQSELVLDAELLENFGALDLTHALDLSASVARQNNFGGLWNSFAIRGFVGDENLPSNYLVNGFNAGRGFGGARDLSGIESVQVLKGPRAALFGRGEPGGTINLVTKRPNFETEGELSVSIGSFSAYRTDFDYTTPLSDSVAIRIVGFYEDAESFRDTIETQKQGLSPSIAWQISDASKLVYELEYSDQKIPFDRGVVAVGLTGETKELGVIPISRFLGEPGDGPIDTGVVGHQFEFQHEFNEDWSALVGLHSRNTSLKGFATENGFYGSRQFLEIDGENLSRFRRFRDYYASYQVFRAELSGSFETAGVEHRLIIGLDADEFENEQLVLRARGGSVASGVSFEDAQVINIFNPIYGQFPLPEPTQNSDRVEVQESIGLYVQDQISLTDKFDIRFGARFDDYQQQLTNRLNGSVSDYAESRVSPQFGLVYRATDTLSVYAAYGENFRPLSGATEDNGLTPNVSTSMELGVKFTLNDGALEGTVAIFDVDQSNISTVDENFIATAIGQAGSQGIEFDLQGELAENLSLLLSYSYLDAATKNVFSDPNFGVEVPAGTELLNIPEHQASLQIVQQTALAGNDLDLIGSIIYVDERNGFFGQDFTLPSYTTVRVAAHYELTSSIGLRAEVQNLFDTEFYTNSFADVWVQPGAPRSFRLTADIRF